MLIWRNKKLVLLLSILKQFCWKPWNFSFFQYSLKEKSKRTAFIWSNILNVLLCLMHPCWIIIIKMIDSKLLNSSIYIYNIYISILLSIYQSTTYPVWENPSENIRIAHNCGIRVHCQMPKLSTNVGKNRLNKKMFLSETTDGLLSLLSRRHAVCQHWFHFSTEGKKQSWWTLWVSLSKQNIT